MLAHYCTQAVLALHKSLEPVSVVQHGASDTDLWHHTFLLLLFCFVLFFFFFFCFFLNPQCICEAASWQQFCTFARKALHMLLACCQAYALTCTVVYNVYATASVGC